MTPEVFSLARQLAKSRVGDIDIAAHCFEWVRDEVFHTSDHQTDIITCSASEVLKARTGFCYAKSHLLAALLRANGIAAGFVYQRLALDENGSLFCLHGLNAVWLEPYGWYRVDPRGNRNDLLALFDPPTEKLPFVSNRAGEQTFPGVYADPLSQVVAVLQQFRSRPEVEAHLPDANTLPTPDWLP